MSDARRCRRCKRKRLDDEPPEVQQYKTCAKCRIIERTKKKLRKPLAEETMRYGLKQFHEQNQNANFIHEEIFYGEQLRKELEAYEKAHGGGSSGGLESVHHRPTSSSQNSHLRFSMYQPSAVPLSDSNVIATAAAATAAAASQYPSDAYNSGLATPPFAGNHPGLNLAMLLRTNQKQQQQQQQLHLQQQQGNLAVKKIKLNTPLHCELCSTKLDPTDPIHSSYRLCRKCYKDPFDNDNVYGSFNEYLSYISERSGKQDLKNLIFICEMDGLFVDDLESSKPINSETQFREFLLESLTNIYLSPMVAAAGIKYQISSNVNELSPQATPYIKYSSKKDQFINTNPIKIYYKYLKEDSGSDYESNMYLNYNMAINLLIIKINFLTNKKVNYPETVIKYVDSVIQSKDNDYTYDSLDALKLYTEVTDSRNEKIPKEVVDFLSQVSQEQFVKDLPSFQTFEEQEDDEEDSSDKSDASPEISQLQSPPEDGGVNGNDDVEKPVDPVFAP